MFLAGLIFKLPASINLPPAYYNYASLAAALKSQGLKLDTRKAPDRVVVLSVHDRASGELASALAYATGDLITPTADGWTISENPATKSQTEHLVESYVTDYGRQLLETLQAAIVYTNKIEAAAPADKNDIVDEITNSASKSTQREATAARLAYDMSYGEYAKGFISLSAALLDQGPTWVNTRIVNGTMSNFAATIWPNRTASDDHDLAVLEGAFQINPADPAGLQTFLNTTELAFGIRFDPLTGGLAGQLFVDSTHSGEPREAIMDACIVPRVDMPICSWDSYLSSADQKKLAARRKTSIAVAESLDLKDSAIPPGLLRPSSRLLKWAKDSGRDLIFPVSALTDVATNSKVLHWEDWLKSETSGSLPADGLPAWQENPHLNPIQALTPGVSLTAKDDAGLTVFRDELGFLDQMAEVPESQALEVDNRSIEGEARLEDLIAVASKPTWSDFKGGSCCAGLQGYNDFVGSVPFLDLMGKDPKLLHEIEGLPPEKSAVRVLSALSLDDQDRFLSLIKACSHYIEPGDVHRCGRLRSWTTRGSKQLRTTGMHLEFTRMNGGGLSFSFLDGNGFWGWSAQLENFRE